MSDLQNRLQKIETKFPLLVLAENECTRILQRNKIKKVEEYIAVIGKQIR